MDVNGMRVGIIGYSLDITGGESRQIVNFARGMQKLGATPVIFTLAASPEVRAVPALAGVEFHSDRHAFSRAQLGQVMGHSRKLSSKLGRLVHSSRRCDVYLIAQDAALRVVEERLPAKVVQYCCGDLSLLLLDKGFRKSKGLAADVFSLGFARQIERHASWARHCDKLIANSRFTSGLISYLYDTPFDQVVYPPVDTELFRSTRTKPKAGFFALAILRGSGEPSFKIVEHLAKTIPVVVVGGATVAGARNLGRVSDAQLVSLYSDATVTLSPSLREFFGYPIVESMACGTPALAFAQGGPLEIIRDGENGWLRADEKSFLMAATELEQSENRQIVGQRAQQDAQEYSIDRSSRKLLDLLR
jgi:glycosyltransferase involved in cell wall biosynthesis